MCRVVVHGLAALVFLAAPFRACAQNVIFTVAGDGFGRFSGDGGPATKASLNFPGGVAIDSAGNVYIADSGNHRIRKVTPDGIITTLAGTGVAGFAFPGDGVPATDAKLNSPTGVAADGAGNVYIADRNNHRIRKVGTDGIISTVAGDGFSGPCTPGSPVLCGRFSGDGGPATKASLNYPLNVAVDAAGNIYIADTNNDRIRKVTPAGVITTVAGNGKFGFAGDGGFATFASLAFESIFIGTTPQGGGLALDAAGNIYIADNGNQRIRKVGPDPSIVVGGQPAITITTVAGNGDQASSGDGGPAIKASLAWPTGVVVDTAGNLYIAQLLGPSVRRVNADGIISTIAGTGAPGFSGDGGPATSARLDSPFGLAVEAEGSFFIADKGNHRIRKVQPAPRLTLQPASLGFQATAGAGNPPAQTLSITNAASGTLNWSVQFSTEGGGNWLSVSPTSGRTPATIFVSVNVTGLSAGTYAGRLVIVHSADPTRPETANVTLTVSLATAARIALNPSALQFSASVSTSPAPQTFQVQNAGTGALGWTATVATQSGGAWLAVSPTTGVAPSTLTVTVNSASLPAGMYAGSITITALASANATNSPQALAVILAVGAPTISQDGVVNGASFSKEAVVSPGSIASLFGISLAAGTAAVSEFPVPTTLAGTQVLVNNTPAPLFFVSPSQINFQMPAEAAGTTAQVNVVSGALRGQAIAVKVAPEVPGIFTAVPGGTGQGAVLNQDFSPNPAQNSATPGSVVQIFATGLGATNPPAATGQPGATSAPFHLTVMTPAVMIGGASAEVLFSALAPGFVGLYQVNARVPAGTAAGSAVPLQIQIGGRSSNTVTLAVR